MSNKTLQLITTVLYGVTSLMAILCHLPGILGHLFTFCMGVVFTVNLVEYIFMTYKGDCQK